MSDTAPAITPPDVDLMFLLSWSNHALSSEMAANLADLGISPAPTASSTRHATAN